MSQDQRLLRPDERDEVRRKPEENAYRRRLTSLAHRYAQGLVCRPGVAGLALYGSLACSDPADITEFSDIDYALVLEGELPSYFVEHRVVEGVRADILFYRADDVRDLAAHPPTRLYERGWVMHFLIQSLLLGGQETILFDPQGEVARIERELSQATSYAELARPDASRWFHEAVQECLVPAQAHREAGEWRDAVDKARGSLCGFGFVLQTLSNRKDRKAAAERLGIPSFDATARRLEELSTPRNVEAIWQAARGLWDHALRTAYEPVKVELVRAGVPEPAKLDLVGDYGVFWGGSRIHELGRVIDDVNLSLAWSRSELDGGDPTAALAVLWPVATSSVTVERWQRLDRALQGAGHDLSGIIERFLEGEETRRLIEALDRTHEEAKLTASHAEADEALRSAAELRDLLAGALPLLPPPASPNSP